LRVNNVRLMLGHVNHSYDASAIPPKTARNLPKPFPVTGVLPVHTFDSRTADPRARQFGPGVL
jgi:hypothetical protein